MSKNTNDFNRRKLMIVGDDYSGKTSLLITFFNGSFPSTQIPMTYEIRVVDISLGLSNGSTKRTFLSNSTKHSSIELALWDTVGKEEYDRLRPLAYPATLAIVLCFAIDSRMGFEDVEERWIQEVTHHLPGVPIILVGCKSDLRSDHARIDKLWLKGERPISSEEGQALAQKIGAKEYLECSAKNGEGVKEVFECAAREAFLYTKKGKKKRERFCVIL
ncbi:P-loop containing nucleoside triphosphate hydrolase protein [Coprinopsis sp. MPI-PUGE-AT-0042]|nr:P-loop containing nucleoside triphosphate hydrolase protein [Coprinopsis sp. MPI-PUGE-AT-0042]